MRRVNTRSVTVLLVAFAVCSLAIAPVAAAGTDDSDSGTSLGAGLDAASDSSGGSTDSSGDGSGDSTTSSDTSDASSDDGTAAGSDGSADRTSDSTDGSTDSNGDAGFDDDSNDGLDDDSDGGASVSDALDTVPTGAALGIGSLTEELATASVPGTDSSSLSLSSLDGVEGGTTVDGGVSADGLAAKSDALLDGSPTAVEVGTILSPLDATDPVRDGVAPTRLDGGADATAPSSNRFAPGAASGGADGLPAGPTSGLALGLGAVAVAAVGRHGAATSGLLPSLGTTLTASVAPLARSSRVLDRLVRTLAPFRYSRYDDSDPLEHEARSAVYDVVDDAPGAYLSELADRADLPLSTVRHHVRVLEREDLVSGAKVRGKRRFYPAYTEGIELAAALEDDSTAAVIDAIARFGAASVSDIAEELGRDPSTVSHHLSRLEADEIIVRERDGRAVMNKLSPEARTALEPGRDAPIPEAGEAMASD